ncbi:MAG: hypothetical protein ABII06_22470 [Pseudomonadota bacterium]
MKRAILLSIILLAYLALSAGCGTVKSWYKAGTDSVKSVSAKVVPGKRSGLKKRVLLLPLMDQAGLGEKKTEEVTGTLVNFLQQDGSLILERSSISLQSATEVRSPELGIVIDPELAQMSEEMGMNVLVTGILSPFEITSKKTGIWPWRKLKREIEISMIMNVFDITNGTLFLSSIEKDKVKMDVDQSGEIEGKLELDDMVLNKAITGILNRHASAIRETLRDQPWTGRLMSAANNKIMINAGKDVGIRSGSVFEVFGEGESLRSASGQLLYLLGPKVGEVKITEVMERLSSAVPLSGEQFKPGHIIRPKN